MQTQHEPRQFSADALQTLGQVDEVQIEPRSLSGQPVTIWVVVWDADVYVRSYKGQQGRWYRALIANPEGILHVGNRELPFRAIRVEDPRMIEGVSEAFRRKYEQQWPQETAEMLREEVLPTTLKLQPAAAQA